MPTYSYACSQCDERFDAVQSIHDDALTTCPACGGTVRRVISAVGVSFKGSGFYRTDSRSDSKSKSGSKPAPAATPSTSDSSKPSTKSTGSTSAGASPS